MHPDIHKHYLHGGDFHSGPSIIGRYLMRACPYRSRHRAWMFAAFAGMANIEGGVALAQVTAVNNYWSGANSSSWFDLSNWTDANGNHLVPDFHTNITYINTLANHPTVIDALAATSRIVRIGDGAATGSNGSLTVENGGTLTTLVNSGGGYVAVGYGIPNPATASLTVTGPASRASVATFLYVGLGDGDRGTVNIDNGGQATIGQSIDVAGGTGSTGNVNVSGQGSTFRIGGDAFVGDAGHGVLNISDGGQVEAGGNVYLGAGPQSVGTLNIMDAGSILTVTNALNVGYAFFGSGAQGTLTISNGASVTAGSVAIAQTVGSTGTLNIGAPAGATAVAPGALNSRNVTFGNGDGRLVFNHTDNSGNYLFPAAISGTGTVDVLSGETVMTGASTYAGSTTISGGTLAAGAVDAFSQNSDYAVTSGGTMNLRGFDQRAATLVNAGLVRLAGDPGTTLTTTQYTGQNGTLALDTVLGGDGSPSDKLVIDRGAASGTSKLAISNAGGTGALTQADGIPVVVATDGGTTQANAFELAGEARGGAYDYRLHRGGLAGGAPDDWFLRSTFVVGPEEPSEGAVEPPWEEENVLPETPLPPALPDGEYPVIGPEVATYSVVQPLARQLGVTMLGTMHERIGDTLSDGAGGTNATGVARSAWARAFGQQVDNRYQTFTDARANGSVIGVQAGLDLWRGSLIPGHHDAGGVYFAYGNGNVDVDGLVTNTDATAYALSHTGKVNLNAYSGGAYWTHYGPGGWYVDAVLQGTYYDGDATTQYARLPVSGSGIVTSLEAGYPFHLPLGPNFVLEPQLQIIWQHVGLDDADDGLGPVDPGSTSGVTGRLGVRGQWTIERANGQVWQPYLRANIWRDWGAHATTVYAGADQVPLAHQVTRMDVAAGVSAKLDTRWSLYGQFGYQFSINSSSTGSQKGVWGDVGCRYAW
ncbi:autotransporter outer membrane beta-barrel domain-containing protein [Paraburkholderia sp. CNPSo 3281]|nr:autotransporter outer membrane beta-barrel domain-containing protein [Paraburkholderia sp. CNPSo 3281]